MQEPFSHTISGKPCGLDAASGGKDISGQPQPLAVGPGQLYRPGQFAGGVDPGVAPAVRVAPQGLQGPGAGVRRQLLEQFLAPLPGGCGEVLPGPFRPGLGDQDEEGFSCLTSLADGSVILGSASLGLQLLSPLDALQERLEQLVEQGKTAVQAGDLAGFRQVELELAYLCAPSVRSFAAVNHAAHDQGRLEARKPADPDHGRPQAVPLVPVIKDLMLRHVHGYAERSLGELLRARLALRELRRYAEPLG